MARPLSAPRGSTLAPEQSSPPVKRPRGEGSGARGPRETSGATTRLILEYVRDRAGGDGVEEVLHRSGLSYPASVLADEDQWFSFPEKIALFEAAGAVLDDPAIGRHVGESALHQPAGARQKLLFRALGGPRRLLLMMPWVARKLSTALEMWARKDGPNAVVVGYRVSPHLQPSRVDCDYNIGLLSQAGPLFGYPPLAVDSITCQVDGDPECLYRVSVRARSWLPARLWRSRRAFLRDQLASVTEQFEALQRTSADLVSDESINALLDRIAMRASGAVQGRRWLLVVRTSDHSEPRVLHEGLDGVEVDELVRGLLTMPAELADSTHMVIDIKSSRRLYGRLVVVCDDTSYIPEERRLLEVYARHAAAALDAATALDEARRQSLTSNRLLGLADRLATARSPVDVAQTLAEAASEVADADSAAVLLWDPELGVLETRGTHALTPELQPLIESLKVSLADSEGLGRMIEDHQPRIITPSTVRTDFGRWILQEAAAHRIAIFPLVAHDVFYGVVAARWVDEERSIDNDDLVARMSGLAHQGATSLESTVLLDRVRHQALHDPLTGLANRDLFVDRLEQEIRRARREGTRLAVLYVDLDRFKKINDRLGHHVGNEVLCETARRLRSALREQDTVARMGGDEFTVLLPGIADAEQAELVANNLLTACSRPQRSGSRSFTVTPSIGIAVHPEHGATAGGLLRHADVAMYQVKDRGRNGCQMYDGHSAGDRYGALSLENDLRLAVEAEELLVAYQPVIDLVTGRVDAVEALARWQHPQLGLLHPERFIALSEDIGMIGRVDRVVMRSACRQAASWQASGLALRAVAVNVSAQAFKQPHFVEEVEEILGETGLRPECLEIEITESLAVGETQVETDAIDALEALGVGIAIDDFGTRYAILGRLRNLPIDTIKIDRSFVGEINGPDVEAPIVSAILAMGESLGLRVVAEGVETEDQLDVLRRHGCSLAQGFLFSRPRSPDAVVDLLRRGVPGIAVGSGLAG